MIYSIIDCVEDSAKPMKTLEPMAVIQLFIIDRCIIFVPNINQGYVKVSKRVTEFFTKKTILFIGKISYSLYLYHLISLFATIYLLNGILPLWAILIISAATSIAIATLTYNFIEFPSMMLGRYWSGKIQETAKPTIVKNNSTFKQI
jgi:peptidoglycan/LPS O-acetylase OafA/YrhL